MADRLGWPARFWLFDHVVQISADDPTAMTPLMAKIMEEVFRMLCLFVMILVGMAIFEYFRLDQGLADLTGFSTHTCRAILLGVVAALASNLSTRALKGARTP